MFRNLKIVLLLAFLICFSGCKEEYDPSLKASIIDYLVVEGFINARGKTSIQLSRTQKLKEKGVIQNEAGATVRIEGDDGSGFLLAEKGDGLYASDSISLPQDHEYRLRIITAGSREYLSDFTPVKVTPGNEVEWKKDPDGVRFTVSTGDEKRETTYYQWVYQETWEIRSFKLSEFVVMPTRPYLTVKNRDPEEIPNLFLCWGRSRSSDVLIRSTLALSQDRVDKFPLVFIPNGSDKLAIRYSFFLQQYALTREAYEFFQLMRKNSQEMGSVFDPQPSLERGNIRCISDPSEPVIGYIVSAVPVEKRIFITSKEAGDWKSSLKCSEMMVSGHPDSLYQYFRNDINLITSGILNVVYNASTPICVDCRLRGNNVRPDFW